MGFDISDSGIRRHPERSGSHRDLHRNNHRGPTQTTFFVLAALLFVLVGTAALFAASYAHGFASLPPVPQKVPVDSRVTGAGAPPGYGLTNPSALQARGPILINGNSQLTTANGVRGGDGTLGNPYIIRDWFIDGSLYPNTDAMLNLRTTTAYVVIENNKIVNLTGGFQWEGIQIGQYPFQSGGKNVIIRHNEVQSRTAYGISLREGSRDIRVEYNYVKLDASRNWTYGIMTDRNVHNITFYGNYVNAYTSGTRLTVGIQVGDYEVTPDRPATNILLERNTVANATSQGMTSDQVINYTARYNLIFSNYPGYKKVPNWIVRGFMIEEISNGTRVYGNEVYATENGIEVASGYGTYFNNTIHDSRTAIYINDDNAFKEARNTIKDTVYDTTYWNVTTGIRVPSGNGHTVLDVGSGVTPTNFASISLVADQRPSQIAYRWGDSVFNVSMTVAGRQIYDRQVAAVSQDLQAIWTGSALILQVTQFVSTNVAFSLQSATAASVTGSQFRPAAYYQLFHVGGLVSTTTTDLLGNLAFGITAPVSSTYEIRFLGFVPTLSVSIVAPSNNTYVATSSVQTTWTTYTSGPGPVWALLAVDGGPTVNVTDLTTYTAFGLSEGNHAIRITVRDPTGLNDAEWVTFTVDTQPPVVSITNPNANAVTNSSTLLIAWAASDAGSGLHHVEVRLDGGPSLVPTGSTYAIGGFVNGSHQISVTAVDNVGHSSTVSVSFTVDTGSGGASNTPPSLAPAVAAISYAPDASAIDILFTQSMNQTSVVESLALSPSVDYGLQWVNESHLRVVIQGSLVRGAVYQVTLKDTAKGSAGESLEHPFLFQFYAHALDGADAILSTNWTPILFLVIVGLMGANGVTAGFLMFHYRKDADRVRSAFEQVAKRYERQIGSLYERLSRSTTYEKKTRVRFPANSTKFDEEPIVVRRSR